MKYIATVGHSIDEKEAYFKVSGISINCKLQATEKMTIIKIKQIILT